MRCLLALNAGSSSLKFALFDAGSDEQPLAIIRGLISQATDEMLLHTFNGKGETTEHLRWAGSKDNAEDSLRLVNWILSRPEASELAAVGHRIVHGGGRFAAPVMADGDVLDEIAALTPLAPLHQPLGLAPLRALLAERPQIPQICCFDTAFHHDLAPPAARFGIPRKWEAAGIRRYGFHGLSYQSIADQLREGWPDLASKRVIVAHLGSGASLCAMLDCQSKDTTMGFSVLDGLLMGTRPGSIDAGIVLYLQRTGLSVDEVEHLLYYESGLLGVSGISSDVRELVGSDAPSAREAIELFVFRIARETAAIVATLGGIDGLVFTGGIGQNSIPVREMVCERLEWLGVQVDPDANARGETLISNAKSRVQVLILPTDEERTIAKLCCSVLDEGPAGRR